MPGARRKVKPSRATMPAASTASIIAWASAEFGASGFSHSTCFPAAASAVDDLAMQVVGDDHAHGVDVVGLDDGLPAGVVALEAIAPGRVAGEVLVDVRDRDEADGR